MLLPSQGTAHSGCHWRRTQALRSSLLITKVTASKTSPAGVELKKGDFLRGVVEDEVPDGVYVRLQNGVRALLTREATSQAHKALQGPLFSKGESVIAAVTSVAPPKVSTAVFEAVPGEWLADKAGCSAEADAWLTAVERGQTQETYAAWRAPRRLARFLGTGYKPGQGQAHSAAAHDLRPGTLVQGTVVKVKGNAATLVLSGSGLRGVLRTSAVSRGAAGASAPMADVLSVGDTVAVEVERVEVAAGTLPGAPPQVWLSTRDLEEAPGALQAGLAAFNAGAPRMHAAAVVRRAGRAVAGAQSRLDAFTAAERARQEGALSVAAGTLVAGRVVGVSESSVTLELEGGQRGLLHISQVSRDQVRPADLMRVLPSGTAVVAAVVPCLLDSGAVMVGLSTRGLEARGGEMLSDANAVMARARTALEAQRAAQPAPAADVPLVLAPGLPRMDLLGAAAERLSEVTLAGPLTDVGNEAAAAAVASLLQMTVSLEAAVRGACDGDVPWSPSPPSGALTALAAQYNPVKKAAAVADAGGPSTSGSQQEDAVESRVVASAAAAWSRAPRSSRGLLAQVLASRIRARVVAVLAADAADEGGDGAARDAAALAAAAPLLSPEELAVLLSSVGDAQVALTRGGRSLGSGWPGPVVPALLSWALAPTTSGADVLKAGLLPLLLRTGWIQSDAVTPAALDRLMSKLLNSLLPGAADRRKGSAAKASLVDAPQSGGRQRSGRGRGAPVREPPTTSELAVAGGALVANLAAAVVQGAGPAVWVPSPSWWDALLSRLAAAAPSEFLPKAGTAGSTAGAREEVEATRAARLMESARAAAGRLAQLSKVKA